MKKKIEEINDQYKDQTPVEDPADAAIEHQDRDEIEKAVAENQKEKISILESKLAQMEANQQVILDFITKLQTKLNEQQSAEQTEQQQQPMDAGTANTLDMLKGFLQPKQDESSGTLNSLAMDMLRANVEMTKAMQQWFMKKLTLKD